jgi:hypothetical protein
MAGLHLPVALLPRPQGRGLPGAPLLAADPLLPPQASGPPRVLDSASHSPVRLALFCGPPTSPLRLAGLACWRPRGEPRAAAGRRGPGLAQAHEPGRGLTHRSGARPQTDTPQTKPAPSPQQPQQSRTAAGPQLPRSRARPGALWEAWSAAPCGTAYEPVQSNRSRASALARR